MTEWAAKVFWSDVAVEDTSDGWTITLDGRAVKTPAKAPLVLPTQSLAHHLAEEWRAQTTTIDPTSMPATRTANSAIDKVAGQRLAVADHYAAYAETDLLCYRADGPDKLVIRQAKAWDPLLDWAAESFGARLRVVEGVMPVTQDTAALLALRDPVRQLTAFQLAAFCDLVSLSGSLILALAIAEGRLDADAAWQLSIIDEEFQIEQWGADEEAAALAARKRQALIAAADFYALV